MAAAVAGVLGVVVVVVVVALAVSGSGTSAPGPHPLESLFQDDKLLLYSPTATVAGTLDTLKGLGVDRLRVTVLWGAIAPDPTSPVPPAHFAAGDPAAYPAAGWAPYDRLVQMAAARGIGVDFNLTAPGPLWAMAGPAPVRYASHYRPSAAAFGQFVAAVGRRYDGRWPAGPGASTLPRVSFWSVWNEPNQPGWLAPQWSGAGATKAPVAARLYRGLLDAAYSALKRTGHVGGGDTFLVGELAPEGTESRKTESAIPALTFLRALYCVDGSYHPLQGATATALGCPAGGGGGAFAGAHPALFQATGFAHHPYSFFLSPSATFSDPNFAPLSSLPRLEHALDAIFSTYGSSRQLPLYLTEYGYETNPPNPFRGVSPARQSLYLDQAQYMAWSDPRVRMMSQFLLVDSPPDPAFPAGSIGYWSTFQTGLEYLSGARKPSFDAYRLPFFVPRCTFSAGGAVTVFAMVRLAPNGTRQRAQVQWRPSGGGGWRTIATLSTLDSTGSILGQAKPPGSGTLRIGWTSPGGQTVYSRTVDVRRQG